MKNQYTRLQNEAGFDEMDQILYRRTEGAVVVEDVLNSLESLLEDKLLPRKLSIIDDSTKAKFKIDVLELKMVVEKIERVASCYTLIKHAVVHADPMNTALSILIGRSIKSKNYCFDVFSTEQAAKRWVGCDEDPE